MRGGISMDDAYRLSQKDQKVISEIIDENIKLTKKTGMPLI
tara:strand:+ start:363 stop:485 length:123 start_codon:yes stop_codon:yes gene_type:complete